MLAIYLGVYGDSLRSSVYLGFCTEKIIEVLLDPALLREKQINQVKENIVINFIHLFLKLI